MHIHAREVERIAKQCDLELGEISPLEQGARLPLGEAGEIEVRSKWGKYGKYERRERSRCFTHRATRNPNPNPNPNPTPTPTLTLTLTLTRCCGIRGISCTSSAHPVRSCTWLALG